MFAAEAALIVQCRSQPAGAERGWLGTGGCLAGVSGKTRDCHLRRTWHRPLTGFCAYGGMGAGWELDLCHPEASYKAQLHFPISEPLGSFYWLKLLAVWDLVWLVAEGAKVVGPLYGRRR